MAEIDYVAKDVKVSQEAVFNMSELYRFIKNWFIQHRYFFFEKEYLEFLKEGGKSASIKWTANRKMDDYTKFHIEVRIRFKDLKTVKTNKGMLNKGEVSFKFEAYLEKDYENNWEANFFTKFLRGVYDKFIIRGKLERYSAELLDEMYDVYNEVKAYLNICKV